MKKRIGILLLAAVLLISTVPVMMGEASTPADVYELWCGDVDGNGVVNTTDARITLQTVAKKVTENEAVTAFYGDMDADGELNTTDARMILQVASDKRTTKKTGKQEPDATVLADVQLLVYQVPEEQPVVFGPIHVKNAEQLKMNISGSTSEMLPELDRYDTAFFETHDLCLYTCWLPQGSWRGGETCQNGVSLMLNLYGSGLAEAERYVTVAIEVEKGVTLPEHTLVNLHVDAAPTAAGTVSQFLLRQENAPQTEQLYTVTSTAQWQTLCDRINPTEDLFLTFAKAHDEDYFKENSLVVYLYSGAVGYHFDGLAVEKEKNTLKLSFEASVSKPQPYEVWRTYPGFVNSTYLRMLVVEVTNAGLTSPVTEVSRVPDSGDHEVAGEILAGAPERVTVKAPIVTNERECEAMAALMKKQIYDDEARQTMLDALNSCDEAFFEEKALVVVSGESADCELVQMASDETTLTGYLTYPGSLNGSCTFVWIVPKQDAENRTLNVRYINLKTYPFVC